MLPPEILAERLLRHFNFIVHEMPSFDPTLQRPARNPCLGLQSDEAEALAMGGGAGLPLETTVVRTHTLDAPSFSKA